MTFVEDRRAAQLKFTGENRDFRNLVLSGAVLELLTFGFYRFWLATRIRGYLWSSTEVDGDAAEYLGSGRELLIGFLFAIAILAPFYLGYFLIGVEAERVQQYASLPIGLFYYGFLQFAIYRGRRYRLNRTMWRGVRFGMDGSGVAYALKSMGWAFLVFVTLGIAWPWRAAALERQKMKHTFYGGLRGEFVGTGGELMARVWPFYIGVILVGPVMAVVTAFAAQDASSRWLPGAAGLALAIAFPFAFAMFRAREWKWWVDGMRLGPIAAQSRLRQTELTPFYWAVIGLVFLLGIGAVFVMSAVTGLAAVVAPGVGLQGVSWTVVAGAALVYLSLLLAMTAIMRIYTMQRIWKTVVASTTLTGLEQAGEVLARSDNVTALGEGIADGFDVLNF